MPTNFNLATCQIIIWTRRSSVVQALGSYGEFSLVGQRLLQRAEGTNSTSHHILREDEHSCRVVIRFLAKPLVYTPLKGSYDGRQLVIACSETNWVYVLDAINGTIYNKRQLHRPFMVSDITCNDVSPQVGITGTPVIDPDTDVMYLYSKTYLGAQNGVYNAVYYFHGIDVNTLTDVYPPVNVNGGPANNDPNGGIYFTGGIVLQRTSLSLINGAVWAGFGGHCDLVSNYIRGELLRGRLCFDSLADPIPVQLYGMGYRCATYNVIRTELILTRHRCPYWQYRDSIRH
jgi:hypothetical protein